MNNGDRQAKASPLARRIAAAKSIDLHGLNGSGPGGKIVKADLGLPDVCAGADRSGGDPDDSRIWTAGRRSA